MRCPECGEAMACIDSRPSGNTVWRRHKCDRCGKRFTTYELFDYELDNITKLLDQVERLVT